MQQTPLSVDVMEKTYLGSPDIILITWGVRGNQDIPLQQLRQAVLSASEANPTIRHIVKGHLGYSCWQDSQRPPPVYDHPDWDGSKNLKHYWQNHSFRCAYLTNS